MWADLHLNVEDHAHGVEVGLLAAAALSLESAGILRFALVLVLVVLGVVLVLVLILFRVVLVLVLVLILVLFRVVALPWLVHSVGAVRGGFRLELLDGLAQAADASDGMAHVLARRAQDGLGGGALLHHLDPRAVVANDARVIQQRKQAHLAQDLQRSRTPWQWPVSPAAGFRLKKRGPATPPLTLA